MSFQICYWICALLWLVLGAWSSGWNWKQSSPSLLLFIMLALLGYKVFGAPLHG